MPLSSNTCSVRQLASSTCVVALMTLGRHLTVSGYLTNSVFSVKNPCSQRKLVRAGTFKYKFGSCMELSIFLAKVLGLYLIIVPAAVLLNRRHLARIIEEFCQSLALIVLSGFMALVLGLLVVVSHNIWSADWRVITT